MGLDTESYEVALKNSLRQAPDMILIGEIRSRETMEYAMTFAETGHLCMATFTPRRSTSKRSTYSSPYCLKQKSSSCLICR